MFFVLFVSNNVVNAHSGRTDESGGHCNYATGEYHYHSGPNAGESFFTEKCIGGGNDNDYFYTNNYSNNSTDYNFFHDTLLPMIGLAGIITLGFYVFNKLDGDNNRKEWFYGY